MSEPECPHGCGPLQWVDDQYICPDCGDEWMYETIHGEAAESAESAVDDGDADA